MMYLIGRSAGISDFEEHYRVSSAAEAETAYAEVVRSVSNPAEIVVFLDLGGPYLSRCWALEERVIAGLPSGCLDPDEYRGAPAVLDDLNRVRR